MWVDPVHPHDALGIPGTDIHVHHANVTHAEVIGDLARLGELDIAVPYEDSNHCGGSSLKDQSAANLGRHHTRTATGSRHVVL